LRLPGNTRARGRERERERERQREREREREREVGREREREREVGRERERERETRVRCEGCESSAQTVLRDVLVLVLVLRDMRYAVPAGGHRFAHQTGVA